MVAPPAPVRDASLRSISIACGELYPAFDPQIYEYTVYVTAEQSEKSCAITAVPSDPYSSVSVSGEEKFVNTDIKRKIRVYNGGLTEEYTLQIHVMDNSEYYANGVHYEQMNEPDLTALPGVFRTVSATGFKGRIAQSTGLSMLLVQYEDSANAEHTIWRRYEPTSRTLTTVSFVTIEGKKYISCDSEDNILFLNNKQGDMYYIKNADGQVDLLVRTDNVALEEKSGLLSHISTAALLAVIAVLLAGGPAGAHGQCGPGGKIRPAEPYFHGSAAGSDCGAAGSRRMAAAELEKDEDKEQKERGDRLFPAVSQLLYGGAGRAKRENGKIEKARWRGTMDAVANKIEIREVSQRKTAYLFIKRVFDIVLSLVLIVVLLPLLLLVMAAIAIDSPGPVIFKQKRIGYQGKEFMIFKFRTLSITAPDNVATRKLENIDGCSTKLGRLLRRLSIDELPQLFNILRSDMSFVGFRPVCTSEKKLNALRRKMGVFEGRPGLTGYAQVLGRDSIGVARKARLDAEYQRKRSLRLDLWCMVKSVTVVLSGSGVM